MKAVALCVLAVACAVSASQPLPPALPAAFTATLTITSSDSSEATVVNVWSDSAAGRLLTRAIESTGDDSTAKMVSRLYLTDAYATGAVGSTEYAYTAGGCSVSAAGASTPVKALLGWVADAQFAGQQEEGDSLVTVWKRDFGANAGTIALYVAGSTPLRMETSSGATITFTAFDTEKPCASVFAVPAMCARARHNARVTSKAVPFARPTAVHDAVGAMSGNLGIHWKCDICKAAAETLISVGCDGGSALCGPFVEVCDAMCEDGCMAASCSDWACKKFGFC